MGRIGDPSEGFLPPSSPYFLPPSLAGSWIALVCLFSPREDSSWPRWWQSYDLVSAWGLDRTRRCFRQALCGRKLRGRTSEGRRRGAPSLGNDGQNVLYGRPPRCRSCGKATALSPRGRQHQARLMSSSWMQPGRATGRPCDRWPWLNHVEVKCWVHEPLCSG